MPELQQVRIQHTVTVPAQSRSEATRKYRKHYLQPGHPPVTVWAPTKGKGRWWRVELSASVLATDRDGAFKRVLQAKAREYGTLVLS